MSSVPTEARNPSDSTKKLIALEELRDLTSWSVRILGNNKNFKRYPSGDPEDDQKNPPHPRLVDQLELTIVTAYLSANNANETPFTKENYRHRRKMQDRSIALLNDMKGLVEMSVPVFHIPYRRFEYWTGRIVCIRGMIVAWKKSDYQRYRRM